MSIERHRNTPNLIPLTLRAKRWGVRPATARAWARRGILPAIKLGQLLFADVRELRDAGAYVRERLVAGDEDVVVVRELRRRYAGARTHYHLWRDNLCRLQAALRRAGPHRAAHYEREAT